jgi:beta-lactamase regulating signal transducer with metallopeptidase domain
MSDLLTLETLFGLLIKSSLIALAGVAAARLLARHPSERADILRVTMVLLLVLPLATAFAPSIRLALLPAPDVSGVAPEPLWTGTAGPIRGVAISGVIPWPSPVRLLGVLWAVGAVAGITRLAAGLWTLNRWTREAVPVRSAGWTAALDRLAPTRPPRLRASQRVDGPLSWGLPPGTILIDPPSLADPATASAVLAHEMAHVRRHDWALLMLSRVALILFWFNPLVWKAHADLAQACEEAADAEAVSHVGRHAYARALVGLAAAPRSNVALAMAADPLSLKKRIASIMTKDSVRRRPLTMGLTIAALVAVATPLAALELGHLPATPAVPPSPPVATAVFAPIVPAVPAAPRAQRVRQVGTPPAPPAPPSPPRELALALPSEPAAPLAPLAPVSPPLPWERLSPPEPPAPPGWQHRSGIYVIDNGTTREATPEERLAAERARHETQEARALAETARADAARQRVAAAEARANARVARARTARSEAQSARDAFRITRQEVRGPD